MTPRAYKKLAKHCRAAMIDLGEATPDQFWCVDVVDDYTAFNGAGYEEVAMLKGTPMFLPEEVDYWGEANDPQCCAHVLSEIIFWQTQSTTSIMREVSRG